jgi:hypothetical protein
MHNLKLNRADKSNSQSTHNSNTRTTNTSLTNIKISTIKIFNFNSATATNANTPHAFYYIRQIYSFSQKISLQHTIS